MRMIEICYFVMVYFLRFIVIPMSCFMIYDDFRCK